MQVQWMFVYSLKLIFKTLKRSDMEEPGNWDKKPTWSTTQSEMLPLNKFCVNCRNTKVVENKIVRSVYQVLLMQVKGYYHGFIDYFPSPVELYFHRS